MTEMSIGFKLQWVTAVLRESSPVGRVGRPEDEWQIWGREEDTMGVVNLLWHLAKAGGSGEQEDNSGMGYRIKEDFSFLSVFFR